MQRSRTSFFCILFHHVSWISVLFSPWCVKGCHSWLYVQWWELLAFITITCGEEVRSGGQSNNRVSRGNRYGIQNLIRVIAGYFFRMAGRCYHQLSWELYSNMVKHNQLEIYYWSCHKLSWNFMSLMGFSCPWLPHIFHDRIGYSCVLYPYPTPLYSQV